MNFLDCDLDDLSAFFIGKGGDTSPVVPEDNNSIDSLGSLITDIFSQPIDIEVSSWIKGGVTKGGI